MTLKVAYNLLVFHVPEHNKLLVRLNSVLIVITELDKVRSLLLLLYDNRLHDGLLIKIIDEVLVLAGDQHLIVVLAFPEERNCLDCPIASYLV